MASQGILYFAIGQEYIQEACRSAASVKAHSPHLSITVAADTVFTSTDVDQVVPINSFEWSKLIGALPGLAGWGQRIHSMYLCSPYDYTLALDTDTYICHDITDLFRLLERFDIAAAHAPVRLSPQAGDFSQTYQNDEIPEGFPEMNCGCILFKKTKQVEDFFADWLHLYQAQIQQAVQPSHDQASFRAALYKSDLKIGILPPEYNCRFIFPCFVSGPVKILHGRHPDLPSVVRTINAETCPRVFLEWDTLQTSQLFLNLEILKAENNKLSEQLEALAIQLSSPRVNLPKKVFKRLAKVWNTLKGKF